jgi:hypothetical protein
LEKRQCDFVPAKLKIAAHIVHGSHLDGSRELDSWIEDRQQQYFNKRKVTSGSF